MLILTSQKIPQGAKCANTPNLYTTQHTVHGKKYYLGYLSDLLLAVQDIYFANYADDSTIYPAGESKADVILLSLQESSRKLLKWFVDDQMKNNSDKCQLIFSTDEVAVIQIGDSTRPRKKYIQKIK